ncbi:thioester reductase domain-containing protein [Streptomyces naphthomycinicus]|uniref:thioester reductase domain-containing protein n=1 Tax=Streptomyces naphthomycinicus TaxID=2872625 RepID=UPI001CECE6E0|nr:thioester reductase domain-containing protein [Streptomyces sp. TML10]
MDEPDGMATARNPGVDRRREGELIETGPAGPAAVADLLAGLRPQASPPPAPPRPDTPAAPEPPEASKAPDTPEAPGGPGGPAATGADDGPGDRPRDRPWDVPRLASAIAATASRFLDHRTLDAETDFFDAGASSVSAVELVAALDRELDVQISLDDVFADGRPRRLAERWLRATDQATATATGTDLLVAEPRPLLPQSLADEELAMIAADLAMADSLPFRPEPLRLAPRRILLTGATGFLGSHLLFDLLRYGDAHVVCLVRGEDDKAAEKHLADSLASFDLPWTGELRRRITVLRGDVRAPRLGLTENHWNDLARDTDAIVNVAAAVDFLRGYPSLRNTNVLGPLTLARLAMTGPPKPLHHVSSIAVFNEIGITAMGEDDPVAHIDGLVAGYDKSKWAAEAVLRRAREHGLTVTLLRPGGIAGHTQTGAYNAHDLSCGFNTAFFRYRTVPAFRNFNFSAVDWVSRISAAIVYDPSAWGLNYNLAGRPNTLPELLRDMQLSGMNMKVMEWDEWRADFLARWEADPIPQLDFLARVMRSPTAVKLCEATLLGPPARGERTERFAARHDLPAPFRYDAAAGLKNYERLARDGLIALPHPTDPPLLWFPETMRGRIGPVGGVPDTPCQLRMTLSIASMYQLTKKRGHTIDIRRGELICPQVHRQPVTVESGEIDIRPDDGMPLPYGESHPLLHYRLRLRDRDGRLWWLEGWKTARPHHDVWKQARTLSIEIGRDGGPAVFAGRVKVRSKSYLREQVDGIRVDPGLSLQEQRIAKAAWLAWFVPEMVKGLAEPWLRAAADVLDLRRDAIDRQNDSDRAQDRKRVKSRERWPR